MKQKAVNILPPLSKVPLAEDWSAIGTQINIKRDRDADGNMSEWIKIKVCGGKYPNWRVVTIEVLASDFTAGIVAKGLVKLSDLKY